MMMLKIPLVYLATFTIYFTDGHSNVGASDVPKVRPPTPVQHQHPPILREADMTEKSAGPPAVPPVKPPAPVPHQNPQRRAVIEKPAEPPAVPPVKPPAPVPHSNPQRQTDSKRITKSTQISDVPVAAIPAGENESREYADIQQLIRELKVLIKDEKLDTSKQFSERGTAPVYTYGVNPEILATVHGSKALRPGAATDTDTCHLVRDVPSSLRDKNNMWPSGIQSHYTKYTEAYGIPVIGSSGVADEGLKRACYILRLLLGDRYDVRNMFYRLFGRFSLIANSEDTTDLPEYSHMDSYWDTRARGLGAQVENPTCSAGDDNARCCCGDRYPVEDILLHELSHGVHMIGATYTLPGFERRLNDAYKSAMQQGLWKDDYASTNVMEYWAVGSTYYFNTRGFYKLTLPNGNKVDGTGQQVLANYDPDLLELLQEVFPCNNQLLPRCQYKDCDSSHFTKLKDNSKGLSLTGCQDITILTGGTLDDCYRDTCHRDGNAFNYLSGECQIKLCTTIAYTSSSSGFNIYKLLDAVTHNMDLTTEQNQLVSQHCVQLHESLPGRCSSVINPISCGSVGKTKCKLRGCCYINGECVYPNQDCSDDLLNCHDGGDTCLSNPYFMLQKCQLSCGVCEHAALVTSAVSAEMLKFCHDKNPQCLSWESTGECTNNPKFMLSECPLSCGLCQDQPRCQAIKKRNRVTCTAASEEQCIMKGCCWTSGSCYFPSDCEDKKPECPTAAYKQECTRNPNWMNVQCPLSCGSCNVVSTLSGCYDGNVNCLQWASSGECKVNPIYMNGMCPLSCGKCTL